MLERLAESNKELVKIIKVDAKEEGAWASELAVRGVPDVRFFKGGKQVHQFMGILPEAELQNKIHLYSSGEGQGEGAAQPAIQPMPENWLPPGVSKR